LVFRSALVGLLRGGPPERSGRRDSNSRPPTWQAGALPLRHFRKRSTQMINNPTAKGKRSEAKILGELVEAGKSVLSPWGEERYDLALDEGGRLVRIQCKTGILRNGCVDFKTCIMDIRRPLGDGGYHGQIEAFAVYCPQTRQAYLVPIEAVPGPTLARL